MKHILSITENAAKKEFKALKKNDKILYRGFDHVVISNDGIIARIVDVDSDSGKEGRVYDINFNQYKSEGSLLEDKPAGAPDWHDSDAPDANGRFRDLSPKDLAAWLIKTRKKDLKRISGSLTQQVVFNRNEDPEYAEKMEKTRKEVYKQLGRKDLLDQMDESVNEGKIKVDLKRIMTRIMGALEFKTDPKARKEIIDAIHNDLEEILPKHGYELFEAKPGPDAYMTGLDDETEEDKKEQMKKQAAMDDDDPNAYKEMPGDKEAREKGKVKTSKHVKSYHELYGDETDEALSDYEDDEADYDEIYKDYPYKDKRKRRKNESVVNEETENGHMLRVMAGVGGDQADEFLSNNNVSLYKIRMALNTNKFTKYDLRDVINGRAPRSIEKKVMRHITESINEAEKNDNGVAKGDRSPIKDDAIETGLKNKSKETGVPIGILRVVMKRGMAAWKTGHRPGATQQQWGYARVNSFLTKQPGTWGGADKDLAKEVRDGGHDKKLKKA